MTEWLRRLTSLVRRDDVEHGVERIKEGTSDELRAVGLEISRAIYDMARACSGAQRDSRSSRC